MGHLVYLTGAPAAGKSTLARVLQTRIQGLETWDYGARLLAHLSTKHGRNVTYDDLRAASGTLVTPDDVMELDDKLVCWSKDVGARGHALIDTHAVTKESYGFRVTPFSMEGIRRLAPSMIVCLFVDPNTTRTRIIEAAEGRLLPSEFEAGLHVSMQVSVVLNYAITVGAPAYILRADDTEEVTRWFGPPGEHAIATAMSSRIGIGRRDAALVENSAPPARDSWRVEFRGYGRRARPTEMWTTGEEQRAFVLARSSP